MAEGDVKDTSLSLEELRSIAQTTLDAAPEGEALTPLERALTEYGLRCSVCVLDVPGARPFAAQALRLGATPEQLHEVLALMAGLGVHTLMTASQDLVTLASASGQPVPDFDPASDPLWRKRVGDSRFWQSFQQRVPGFLPALRRLSPAAFETFFVIGELPTQTSLLPALTRELVSVGVDAMPTHRYLPGMLLHLDNALRLGAGRQQVLGVLDIAAGMPAAPGVRG
jgi:alkylhydroperoxidase/carboxymuconolactone decarboxylase family protein YurZ